MCTRSSVEVSIFTCKLHCFFCGTCQMAGFAPMKRNTFWLWWLSPWVRVHQQFLFAVERNLGQLWNLACCICHCIWRTVYACYAPNFVQPRPFSTKQCIQLTSGTWDCDYHFVMKDHPYILEFCVSLRLSFKTSPPLLNMWRCWFDWLKTQPEALFCNVQLLDFQFVLFSY
jgi:hypothetical protein